MKILIVGAGAVGQVYGYHLVKGGAEVSFYLKEKYLSEAEQGFTLYQLNQNNREVLFKEFNTISSPEQVAQQQWDSIIFTVSSTALRGSWFADIIKASGNSTIMSFHSGPEDKSYFEQHVPRERLISGLITLISYQAPLKGETRFSKPGIAYWLPPLSPIPISGPAEPVQTMVKLFKAGGCSSARAKDIWSTATYLSAVLMPLLIALESRDWNFKKLGQGSHIKQAIAAMRESIDALAKETGYKPPAFRHVLFPLLVKFIVWIAPKVIPLDIETYLEFHFMKVRDQTLSYMQAYRGLAEKHQTGSSAINQLMNKVST